MELQINDGFTTDNLVFGAFNTVTKAQWEFAHVELTEDGRYKVSSDTPHSGINDIYAIDVESAIEAVDSVLNQLIKQ